MEKHDFLKEKYGLHKSEEAESAAKRTEIRTGEKVLQDPSARIGNYLDRFREIIDRKDTERRERGLEALKRILYDKFVIKPQDIPEGYFETQRRIAREQGHGDVEITKEMRRQLTETVIADERSSLDNWIDYLTSADATYPDWLKYYAFRSILGMGEYDKGKKQFGKRSKTTVKPFPDINREALAYVLDAVSQKYGKRHTNLLALNEEERKTFDKLLEGENFPKLYAWAIEKTTVSPSEQLEKTAGKWIKYNQNSDHVPLVESLRGHGTGWCTAGESTAQMQLKGGDFYVYCSLDEKGKPTVPRAAIRMQEGSIAEIRGVAPDQNLDPYIAPVVQEKLKEFPDGKAYEKKVGDMKMITDIERKTKSREPLTKNDLMCLYEIDTPIEGFGYRRDPRIEELRNRRNPEEDMLFILECGKDQIANNISDIREETKAYIGPLVPGIFTKLQEYSIEHIYTSFPEGRIRKETIAIGGKSAKELIKEMKDAKINISPYAEDMMKNRDFKIQKEREDAVFIRLKVRDLGIYKSYPTTDEIYSRIEELGLELCPVETGPNYRLQYQNQPLNEWVRIGMKQISDRYGDPCIFDLGRRDGGLWLDDRWADPEDGWDPEVEFVFRLSKLKNSNT